MNDVVGLLVAYVTNGLSVAGIVNSSDTVFGNAEVTSGVVEIDVTSESVDVPSIVEGVTATVFSLIKVSPVIVGKAIVSRGVTSVVVPIKREVVNDGRYVIGVISLPTVTSSATQVVCSSVSSAALPVVISFFVLL